MIDRKIMPGIVFMCLVIMALFAMALPAAQAEITVTEEWVARYNGPGNHYDAANAIAADSSGNVYVTGCSIDSVGNSEYATVAYDSTGNQLWVASYNSGGCGAAIALDNYGNVYVTGYSWTGTSRDYTTVSYDSLGNQLWVAHYNNSDDIANQIAVDTDGNIYVSGSSSGIGTGFDYATVAYDSSGTQLWVARYGGSAGDYVSAMAIDNAGKVYVTGRSDGIVSGVDYATVAYEASSGVQLWSTRYNGLGNAYDAANAIVVDNAGNVYVTGESTGSGTSYDYATIAYDSFGNQLWEIRYNGPGNNYDAARAMVIDSEGNIYVAGTSRSTENYFDLATIAYDSMGNQLWEARYSSSGLHREEARAMTIDTEGNVIVTGITDANGTWYDYVTIAYDSLGIQLWEARYNGPGNSFDESRAITTDSAGNVYVAGISIGSGSGYDYAAVKYSQGTPNNTPLACASTDQTVECGTTVALDGSCSSDPDGDALTYTWSGPFGTATGASATVSLPTGTHTITLTVDDGNGGTATDTVEVTVADTTPPEVSAQLSGYELLSDMYFADVLFEMEATDTCSGVANVRHILDGHQTIVTGSYASINITTGGDHTIVYDAEDNAGNVSDSGSLSFMQFDGLIALIEHFVAQGLIEPRKGDHLKRRALRCVEGKERMQNRARKRGSSNGACLAFINHVEAQSGKRIDPAAAGALIKAAQYIIAH